MKIPLPMFTAPSYGDRTLNEVQRCVNLYPEKTPQGWKLVGTPGLFLMGTVGNDQPCRGAYTTSTGRMFSVHDNDLYEITNAGTVTDRGDVTTTSGIVRFADNGTSMLIVDGADGYIYNLGTDTLTTIVDANFPSSPNWCTFQDGYFIVTNQGSDVWYLSQLNDGADWTPSTFATAESSGDNLVACISNGQELYLIGVKTVEVWYNTGNPSFPFERINGAIHRIGGADALTIAVDQRAIYMLGYGEFSAPSIWAVSGGGSRQVSPPYIDSLLITGTANGYFYQFEGHRFYSVHTATKTLMYDVVQGTWCEGESDVSGLYVPRRISHVVQNSNGQPFAFDRLNGRIYVFATGTNSENGTAIRRRRIFGPIEAGARRMFHHAIRFVLEIDHDSSASYTLEATLDWTDDGGLTYSTARTLSKAITSGTTGQLVRLETNRLGSSRQRYYRLTFTGPAARIVLQSAELEADVGSN